MKGDYYPDSWVIIKIKEIDLYQIIAGWSGGYATGDYERINSGITHVEDASRHWRFYGASGSCYVVRKKGYATNMQMRRSVIYNQIKDHIELLDKDTDWVNIKWET